MFSVAGNGSGEQQFLIHHGTDFFFHFRGFHHDDGIPGAAVEEATVRALAETLLAADAKKRINLNAAERRMVLVRNPEHAVFDGTVFHAGGRASATRAAFGDDGKFFGLFLARGGDAFGTRLVLQFVRNQPRRFDFGWRSHAVDYTWILRIWKRRSRRHFDAGIVVQG